MIDPRYIFKSSNHKFWFDCNKCNREFESSPNNKSGCPFCVNKTEAKLYDIFLDMYPQLKQRYTVDWCKNKKCLPFDFVLEDIKIIIELDGEQHFKQVSSWKSAEETQKNDKYKMKCANENNFSVIRILQDDVYWDKYDWSKELTQNIEKIKKEKKIQNVYMCKNNEYAVYH